MNDTSPEAPAPRGLAALRHLLVDDEGGSAAVEFIVLIPVYIMMLGAMFSLSLVMLTRQQVVAAARYEAWNMGKGSSRERSDETIARSFIGYTGTWLSRTFSAISRPRASEERERSVSTRSSST